MLQNSVVDPSRIPLVPDEYLTNPRISVVIQIMTIGKRKVRHGLNGSEIVLSIEDKKTNVLKVIESKVVKKDIDYFFKPLEFQNNSFDESIAITLKLPSSNVSIVERVEIKRSTFPSSPQFLPLERAFKLFSNLDESAKLNFNMVLTLDAQCSVEMSKESVGNSIFTGYGIRKSKNEFIPHDMKGYFSYRHFTYSGCVVAGKRHSIRSIVRERLIGKNDMEIDTIFVRFKNGEPDWSDRNASIQYFKDERARDFYEGQLKIKRLRPNSNLKDLKPHGIGFSFTYSGRMLYLGEFHNAKKQGYGITYNVETGVRTFSQFRDDKKIKEIGRGYQTVWPYWIDVSDRFIEKDVRKKIKGMKNGGDIFDHLLNHQNGEILNVLNFFIKYIRVVYEWFNKTEFSEITKNNKRRNLSNLKSEMMWFVDHLVEKLRSYVKKGRKETVRQKLINYLVTRLHDVLYSYYLREFKDEERELKHKIGAFRTYIQTSLSSQELKMNILQEVLKKKKGKEEEDDGGEEEEEDEEERNDREMFGDDFKILEAMRILSKSYEDIGTNVGKKTNKLFNNFKEIVNVTFLQKRLKYLLSHDQFRRIVNNNDCVIEGGMTSKLIQRRIRNPEVVKSEDFVRNFEKLELLHYDFLAIMGHSKVQLLKEILVKFDNERYGKILEEDCHQCPSTKIGNFLRHINSGYQFLRGLMNHPFLMGKKEEDGEESSYNPHELGFQDFLSSGEVRIIDLFAKNMILLFTKMHDDFGRDNSGRARNIRLLILNIHHSVHEALVLSLSSPTQGGLDQLDRDAEKVDLDTLVEEGNFLLGKQFRQNATKLVECFDKYVEKLSSYQKHMLYNHSNFKEEDGDEEEEELEGEKEDKRNENSHPKPPIFFLLKSIEIKISLMKTICGDFRRIFRHRDGISAVIMKCLERDAYSIRHFLKYQKKQVKNEKKKLKNPPSLHLKGHFCSYVSSYVHIIHSHLKSSSVYFENKNIIRTRLHDRSKFVDEETKKSHKLFIRMRERVRRLVKFIEEIENHMTGGKHHHPLQRRECSEEKFVIFISLMTRILKQDGNSLVRKALVQIQLKERISRITNESMKEKLDLLKSFNRPETNCFVFYRIIPFLSFLGSFQRTLIALMEYYRIKKQITTVTRSRSNPLLFFRKEVDNSMKNKLVRKLKRMMYNTLKFAILSLMKLKWRKVFHDFFFRENVVNLKSLGIDSKFIPHPNTMLNFSDIQKEKKKKDEKKEYNVDFYIKSYFPYQNAIDRISVLSEVHTYEEKTCVLQIADIEMKAEMSMISGKKFIEEDHFQAMTIFVLLFSNNINHLTEFNFLEDFCDVDMNYTKILVRYREFLDMINRFVPNEVDALKVQMEVNTKTNRLLQKLWDMGYKDKVRARKMKRKHVTTAFPGGGGGGFLKKNYEVSLHWLERILDYIYCKINTLEEEEDVLEIEMKSVGDDDDDTLNHIIGGQDSLNPASVMVDFNKMIKLDWIEYVTTFIDRCNEILDAIDITLLYESKDRGILKVKFITRFSPRVYQVIRRELYQRYGKYVNIREMKLKSILGGTNLDFEEDEKEQEGEEQEEEDVDSKRLEDYKLFEYQSLKKWREQENDGDDDYDDEQEGEDIVLE